MATTKTDTLHGALDHRRGRKPPSEHIGELRWQCAHLECGSESPAPDPAPTHDKSKSHWRFADKLRGRKAWKNFGLRQDLNNKLPCILHSKILVSIRLSDSKNRHYSHTTCRNPERRKLSHGITNLLVIGQLPIDAPKHASSQDYWGLVVPQGLRDPSSKLRLPMASSPLQADEQVWWYPRTSKSRYLSPHRQTHQETERALHYPLAPLSGVCTRASTQPHDTGYTARKTNEFWTAANSEASLGRSSDDLVFGVLALSACPRPFSRHTLRCSRQCRTNRDGK